MQNSIDNYDWSRLNQLQLGKYAEYLTKMEFLLWGCDVFTSEVDDHGIDFVIRSRHDDESEVQRVRHYDVQVKSFRTKAGTTPYVFLQKDKFRIDPSSLLVLAQFEPGNAPMLFLLQAQVGDNPNPHFENRDYGLGRVSHPEWGITLSKTKLELIAKDSCFHEAVNRLLQL